jgi:WD40 repeat protein
VFLSYARKDGESCATNVRERLRKEAADILLKQDREVLEGGVGWWKQITDAIDTVEFLILIMSPGAMDSPVVRDEWRYARQRGVCVYPVQCGAGKELDFSRLPHWMKKAHFFDLSKEWESFIRHLRGKCNAPRVPFMAPSLTGTFVQRPAQYSRLKAHLLGGSAQPAAISIVLAGAPGFGKTTLATALCHDPEIMEMYDDGILWITLGQDPDLVASINSLYGALAGENVASADHEYVAGELAQKLQNRNCLIVVDDVWQSSHLQPFLRGAEGCARVFTTRNASIAAGTILVGVDEMQEDESVRLLASADPAIRAEHVQALSRRLGQWPLALELARSTIRERVERGDQIQHAIHHVEQVLDQRGVGFLSKEGEDERFRTIDGALDLSLEMMDRAKQEHLAELSIFPEDTPIPFAAAGAVWQLDNLETEEIALKFARLSLLKSDLEHGTIRMHDVLRGLFARNIKEPEKLHSRLIDSWNDWYALPSAYAWQWFAWHLAKSDRHAELHRVLRDAAWLQAKLDATDANSAAQDFEYLKPDSGATLIQGALRLSAYALRDSSQLAGQLIGRLLPYRDEPGMKSFLESLGAAVSRPWLKPLYPSLHPPGTALLRTLKGHSGSVSGIAITADGSRTASVSSDGTLRIWDVESGREVRTLRESPGWGVALSRDGKRAVSSSGDSLIVWDLEAGVQWRTLQGHSDRVIGVALSVDGRRAASGARDCKVKVWDLEGGRAIRSLEGHSDHVYGVALSSDGRRLISASFDKTLMVWDVESGAVLHTLHGHAGPVVGVAISAEGRRAVSASSDKTLKLWDLESGRELRTLVGHSGPVNCVAWSGDGKFAVSGSDDKSLKVWDMETGTTVRTLEGHGDEILGVAMSADGQRVVSTSPNGNPKVWDVNSGRNPSLTQGHSECVSDIATSADGRRAVSASGDRTLKVWEVATGRQLHTLTGHPSGVIALAMSADARRAVSISTNAEIGQDAVTRFQPAVLFNRTIISWDLVTGQALRMLKSTAAQRYPSCIALSSEGRLAVSGSSDGTMEIWDLALGRQSGALMGHSAAVWKIAAGSSGQWALSASADHTLKVWDLASGRELSTLKGHSAPVLSVALSRGGRTAISASADGTLKVWNLATAKELCTFEGHSSGVKGVAFAQDGRLAVSTSEDQTLRIWDVEVGKSVATFTLEAPGRCCAFAGPSIIVAGDESGRVHFLKLQTGGSDSALHRWLNPLKTVACVPRTFASFVRWRRSE